MQSPEIITFTILFTTGIIIMMALFIIYIFFIYNQKQSIQKIIFDKELLNSQLEVQESTFQKVSEELHDNVNQILTLAKLHLVTSKVPPLQLQLQSKINQSIELLNYSIDEIRSFARNLNPAYIAEKGLMEMTKEFTEHIKQIRSFWVTFDTSGEPRYLEDKKEMLLFRIIQEAVTNVIKHAKATALKITFIYSLDHLQVIIEDNGIGFDVNKVKEIGYANGSSGLKNIYKRIIQLNATLDINSTNNKGTTICITTPC